MRLSIIVPAYGVEDYIEKCIRTLESQNIPKTDYEIIVTNDGSLDKSAAIVERLQQEFPNIVLINQHNQGVSMARNNAIAKASGNYIMPIDPDDFVIENTFAEILEKAETQNLDILYLGYEILNPQQQMVWRTNFIEKQKKTFSGIDGYFATREKNVRDTDHSCGILFKKSMIEKFNVKYPKGVPFLEDGLFLIKAFAVAERVGFSHERFYQRTTRTASATGSGTFYSQRAIDGFLKSAADIREFGQTHNFNATQQGMVNHGIANFVLLAIFPLVSFHKLERFKVIKKIKELGFSKLETTGVVDPYLTYARYFNFSPYLMMVVYAMQMAVRKFKLKTIGN